MVPVERIVCDRFPYSQPANCQNRVRIGTKVCLVNELRTTFLIEWTPRQPLTTTLMRSILLGAVIALLLAPVPCVAQSGNKARFAEDVNSYLEPLAKSGKFAGTVLVARDGHILFERSYGAASVELGTPNRNDTRYRIFSITKQFTAMAVLILAHRGAIDLHASVRQYLPELPVAWQAATVQQMLTHTSGIPNDENIWATAFMTNDARSQLENLAVTVPKFAAQSLTEKPGSKWRYNNFVYDLLACIVARVSHEGYGRFVEQEIFKPAGMTDAGFDERRQSADSLYISSAVVPRLASGYNGSPDALMTAAPQMYASRGAGGIYATAEDLFHYDNALNNEMIVPRSVEQQAVDSAFQLRPGTGYGYGWVVSRSTDSTMYIHHSGGTNGYISEYSRYPASHSCIIIMSNRGFANNDYIRDSIAGMLFRSS